MPVDLWNDAARMVGCGLSVAAVAAPVGLASWVLARRAGQPVLPRFRPWRVSWSGFEVIVAVLVLNLVVPALMFVALAQSPFFQMVYGAEFPRLTEVPAPSLEASAAVVGAVAAIVDHDHRMEISAVRGLWTGTISLPVQLGLLLAAWLVMYRRWPGRGLVAVLLARISLAVITWAGLTMVVLGVHAVVNWAFTELGWLTEDHPLSKLSAARPTIDHVLFFFQAGVAAPVIEEVLFRGVLLGWLVGGRSLLVGPPGPRFPRPSADRRVWPVLVIGVGAAAVMAHEPGGALTLAVVTRGPVLFALGLLAGWVVLRQMTRKRRTVGAVYASASLFAVVHSGVWPSPIPLFVLGLGLGWLAVRTRGPLAPAIVHGLFNAVSVLFVLRT